MSHLQVYVEQIVNHIDCIPEQRAELMEELADHLEMLVEEFLEKGYTEEQAIQLACQEFGCFKEIGKGIHHSIWTYGKKFNHLFLRKGAAGFFACSFFILSFLLVGGYYDSKLLSFYPQVYTVLFSQIFFLTCSASALVEYVLRKYQVPYHYPKQVVFHLLSFGITPFIYNHLFPDLYHYHWDFLFYTSFLSSMIFSITDKWLANKEDPVFYGRLYWLNVVPLPLFLFFQIIAS